MDGSLATDQSFVLFPFPARLLDNDFHLLVAQNSGNIRSDRGHTLAKPGVYVCVQHPHQPVSLHPEVGAVLGAAHCMVPVQVLCPGLERDAGPGGTRVLDLETSHLLWARI